MVSQNLHITTIQQFIKSHKRKCRSQDNATVVKEGLDEAYKIIEKMKPAQVA